EPGGCDPASQGFPLQVQGGGVVPFQQPQNAAGHALQDSHPAVEGGRRDLVVVVEAAEYEGIFGQTALGTGGRCFGNDALAVVGLVAARQPEDLFSVVRKVVFGDQPAVGHDVIDEIGAH